MTDETQPRSLAHSRPVLGFVALGLAGVLLVLLGSRWGPGIGYDSFDYMTAAENLTAGRGLAISAPDGAVIPLIHFPPVLPIILAGLIRLGLSSSDAIRLLNAGLFGVNIVLTGLAGRKLSGSSALGLLAAALFFLSDAMILAHVEAMSEGLYLTFSLAALLLLGGNLRKAGGGSLTGAAVLTAGAALTRYIGLSLVPVGAVALLAQPQVPLPRKLRRAAWYSFLSFIPLATWTAYTYQLTGQFSDRARGWHPVDANYMVGVLDTVLTWFLPGRLVHGRALSLFLLGLALATLFLVYWRARTLGRRSIRTVSADALLAGLLAGYLVAYLAMYLLARSTFDEIYLGNRLLLPILQVLILLVVFALTWLPATPLPRPRLLVGILAAALLMLAAQRAVREVRLLYEEGTGYVSRGYHESSTIRLLRGLGDRPISTNAVPAVYFATGKVPFSIWPLDSALDRSETDCGLLVVFRTLPLDLVGPALTQVSAALLVDALPDADVFYSARCAAELQPYLEQ